MTKCALEVADQFFIKKNSNNLSKKMNFLANSLQKFKLLCDNITIYCELSKAVV